MTYVSIGRPVPGRQAIVLSRAQELRIPNVTVASSVPDAIDIAEQHAGSEIFIGGGEEIYRLFLPLSQRIYLNRIHATFGGDRHVPGIDPDEFALLDAEEVQGEIPYTYETYGRR